MKQLVYFFWLTALLPGLLLPAAAETADHNATADDLPSLSITSGISEYSDIGNKGPRDNPITSLNGEKVDSSTADHSQFEALQGPFNSGPEVTKACLTCHNKAGNQFRHNKHWTWSYTNPKTGQQLGKATLINNFCTNARGNEGMCAQCHAGYGMTDSASYDYDNQENMDCLVCHESTGTYYKTPPTQGNKACSVMFEGKPPIEWATVAQSVKKAARSNCGMCHFYGGGGDNVKHGDLSSALFHPSRDVDVHMSDQGGNFSCVVCHVGQAHEWSGSRYQMTVSDEEGLGKPGSERSRATCESCHGNSPHPVSLVGTKLNQHTRRVACETCHIAEYAKGGVATKMTWDWRTAGKTKNGEGYSEEGYVQGNGKHRHTYKSIKGDFTYDENIQPEYRWFNGTTHYTTIDTEFDSSAPVEINRLEGSANDPDSRIYPFKVMHTIQPYDKLNNTLVYMHLWGEDSDAFWGNYDFGRAIDHGMKQYDIPYSGEYDFIETVSYWPINHMVGPKESALDCKDCHVKEGGRLAGLGGFYLPGRDSNPWFDRIGLAAVALALIGVFGHGLIRLFFSTGRKH